jgi:hypothetical protein
VSTHVRQCRLPHGVSPSHDFVMRSSQLVRLPQGTLDVFDPPAKLGNLNPEVRHLPTRLCREHLICIGTHERPSAWSGDEQSNPLELADRRVDGDLGNLVLGRQGAERRKPCPSSEFPLGKPSS